MVKIDGDTAYLLDTEAGRVLRVPIEDFVGGTGATLTPARTVPQHGA